jgi:hypothetical protein
MSQSRALVPFALFVAVAFAAPQEPAKQDPAKPAPAAEPLRRDPEAMKLLAAHDALMYYPREEGLKDLVFTMALPVGVLVDMKWAAPEKLAWTGRPSPEVKPDVAKRLELLLATSAFKDALDAQTPSFVRTMIGGKESDLYAKDRLELLGPKQVKIVAASPETLSKMKEATITFDDQGRLKLVQIASPLGAVSDMEPTYREYKGKYLMKDVKTTTRNAAGAAQTSTLGNEYVEVDGFMLLSKVTMFATTPANGAAPAKEEKQDLHFSGHRPNKGLTDADFKK